MAYRDAASFGKRQEYAAVAELLRLGHDVYMTLVDDQQIDCVIRKEVKGKPVYIDIQIKARSNQCKPYNAGTFSAMAVRKPRRNFFFIFYSEQANCYWVLPSLELVKEATRNKSGSNAGKYRIVFTNHSRKTGEVKPRPRFDKYKDNFELLKEFKG
jgi:hypothetical protein